MLGVKQEEFIYNFDQFDKTAEKVMGLIIGNLYLVNVHFPMEESGRLMMAEQFDKCLPSNKTYHLIIAGDFNAFPIAKGFEQLETMQKVTQTIRISDAALSTSELATNSFKPYPFDFISEESLKMPGKLDHIFVRGFKIADETVPLVHDAKNIEGKNFAPQIISH